MIAKLHALWSDLSGITFHLFIPFPFLFYACTYE